MCTSKVMSLMSVMLDLPGDIMDLNTLTKCLLEKAVDAGAGRGPGTRRGWWGSRRGAGSWGR